MVSPSTPTRQSTPVTDIGVGIDTSRYGHYAAFLDERMQQAAPELEVLESAPGYAKLRQRFIGLVQKHGRVQFHVRVDVAGAYADNLLASVGNAVVTRQTRQFHLRHPAHASPNVLLSRRRL